MNEPKYMSVADWISRALVHCYDVENALIHIDDVDKDVTITIMTSNDITSIITTLDWLAEHSLYDLICLIQDVAMKEFKQLYLLPQEIDS